MDCYNWDASQLEILDNYREHECISILGACGTGKTSVLEEIACREMSAGKAVAFLTSDRRAASASQMRIVRKNGVLASPNTVCSLRSFCYSIVQEFAEQTGRARPELVTGPDEDVLIREIIEEGGIDFPDYLSESLTFPQFRNELRNLITRAAELGISPDELDALGKEYEQPLWCSAAQLWRVSFERLNSSSTPSDSSRYLLNAQRLNHSQLVNTARDMLAQWDKEASQANRSAKAVRRPHWDYILVDDFENMPRSILSLLTQLRANGSRIICAGNPDSCIQGFRGAVFSLPLDISLTPPAGLDAVPYPLVHSHRAGENIAQVLRSVTGCIRPPSGSEALGSFMDSRNFRPYSVEDSVEGKRFINEVEESAGIARMVRQWHLCEKIPYGDIAVVTRSRSAHTEIRHELIRRGIPVAAIGSDVILSQQRAVAPLLELLSLSLSYRDGSLEDSEDTYLENQARIIRRILSSPLFDMGDSELDMLAGQLQAYRGSMGGSVSERQALSLLLDKKIVSVIGNEVVARFSAVVDAVGRSDAGNNAEQVLWEAWQKCNVAQQWQAQALSDSEYSDIANENLDAVMQLFSFVARETERHPEISIIDVITKLEAQEIPEDSVARSASTADSVSLITPASAQGREFKCVILARVNEGVWPNLTVRDALSHTNDLSDIVLGRYVAELSPAQHLRAQVRDVCDDELRQLYYALGRAQEKIVITCIENEASQVSRFFDVMGFELEKEGKEKPCSQDSEQTNKSFTLACVQKGMPDFDMTGIVGMLRRYLRADTKAGEKARRLLEELAEQGVWQASPALWFDTYEPTKARKVEADTIRVSPSRVEAILNCPMRGTLEKLGFTDTSDMSSRDIGTIIHSIAAKYKDGATSGQSREDFAALLAEEFQELYRQAYGEKLSGWEEKLMWEHTESVKRLSAFLYDRSDKYEDVEVEKGFRISTDDVLVAGYIDRLEITGDTGFVFDYKTGKTPLSGPKAQDNVQLQLYQLAIKESPDIPCTHTDGAALVYPRKDSEPITQRTQEALNEEKEQTVWQRIEQVVLYERNDTVPAQENDKCRNCSYVDACPLREQGRIFS